VSGASRQRQTTGHLNQHWFYSAIDVFKRCLAVGSKPVGEGLLWHFYSLACVLLKLCNAMLSSSLLKKIKTHFSSYAG
jgi:hypothetical protein